MMVARLNKVKLAIMVLFLTLGFRGILAQQDAPEITLIVQPESLVIYVGTAQAVALNGLQFQVVNGEGKIQTVDVVERFDALKLTNGRASPGSCYVYEIAGSSSTLPNECANPQLIFHAEVALNNVFWYDVNLKQKRTIAVQQAGQEPIICSGALPSCPVRLQIPTATPSPSPTLTFTPEPTLMPTSTALPSATPSPTVFPSVTPSEIPTQPTATWTPTLPPTVDAGVSAPPATESVVPPSSANPFFVMYSSSKINRIAWSDNGKYLLSAHDNGDVCLWLMQPWQDRPLECQPSVQPGALYGLSWAPDDQKFVTSGQNGAVSIWQLKADGSGMVMNSPTFDMHEGPVVDSQWSRDGRMIVTAGSTDGKVIIWPMRGDSNAKPTLTHIDKAFALAWSGDSRFYASAERSGALRVIDISKRNSGRIIGSYLTRATSVTWDAKSSRILTVGDEFGSSNARLFEDFSTATECTKDRSKCPYISLAQNLNQATQAQFSPDGSLIAIALQGGIHVLQGARPFNRIGIYNAAYSNQVITSIAWSPDATVIAGADDQGTISLWSIMPTNPATITRTASWSMTGGKGINAFAWSTGGDQIAAVDLNRTLSIWDVNSQQRLGFTTEFKSNPTTVDWNINRGSLIATGDCDPLAVLWDLSGLPTLTPLSPAMKAYRKCFTRVAFSPNGDWLMTGDAEGVLRLFDWQSGTRIGPQRVLDGYIRDIAWSPSGTLLAASADTGKFVIYDMSGNKFQQIFIRQPAFVPVNAIAWSPTGDRIATASFNKWIAVWVVKGRVGPVEAYKDAYLLQNSHNAPIVSLSWHPTKNWLASLSEDGMVVIWDASTGERIQEVSIRPLQVNPVQIRWSPNGNQFAVVDNTGTISLWNFTE
jgi:WD40 repeat protein